MENYQILSNNYADAEQGFEIQDLDATFISWDTPVRNVLKKHRHLLKVDVYRPLSFVSFLYPVRVGNMIIENLGTNLSIKTIQDLLKLMRLIA